MAKKKIILTSNTSFSLYNFRFGLMKKLKEQGYEVISVAPEDEYSEYIKREFTYYSIKQLARKSTNPIKDLMLFFEFLNLYYKIKPDLVINFTIKPNIYSSLACKVLGISSISVVTGLGYVFVKGGFLEKLVRILYKISFKNNRFVVVLNSYDLEIIISLAGQSKTVLIEGEGVNTEYFSPECCIQTHNLSKTVFLFIGRFLKDKGLIEIVEAGKKLWNKRKDFEVWLLGSIDPGNPQSLKEEDLRDFKKLDFVKILPFTKDVRPFICQADCVVLPSYREGIPRSLLEAMAMEKPIITTESPGCKDVCIDGINGFLVAPRDTESLREALEKFMNLNIQERNQLGKKGREFILQKFDERLILEKYLKIIEKSISSELR